MEPYELTATEALRAMAAGRLTAERWVASCLERIRAREEQVLAWAHLAADAALARAREIDRTGRRGLASGLPFGAKDIIDTADMPTEYGSPIHRGHRPGRDAGCIAILRAAGAVLLGKTVSTEFGHRFPGPTRNPHNPEHTPGGSSSGSAAAVGDRMVPLAFGTQTTGSVIRPSAYCGVVGYKPTYGDINVNGVMPNTPTVDTIGLMARSVEDLALARSALLEEPLAPVSPPPVRGLRIGFFRSPFWERAEEDTRAHLERAARQLSEHGAQVTDATLPGIDADFETLFRRLSGFEFARTVSWERFNRPEGLSAVLREGRMKDGLETTYAEYREATRRLERLRLQADDALEAWDALITPSAPGEAPKGLKTTGSAVFNCIWTSLGTPALTLPVFKGPSGLPVGLQVVAGRCKDRRLFDVAEAIWRALR